MAPKTRPIPNSSIEKAIDALASAGVDVGANERAMDVQVPEKDVNFEPDVDIQGLPDGGADVNFIPSSINGEDFGSGQWLINGMSRTSQNQLVADLALQAHRNSVAGTAIKRPRIGLYRPWAANSDEGWTRWLFETYEIDHTSLYNADVKAGNLKSRYDVIIIADMNGNQIMNGFSEGSVPPRYSGGIGPDGTREIDKFVREGGTLVAINRSSVFAIDELHLPVRNVVGDVPREEYFVGGAIAEILVDKTHPVMSGMPARAKIFVGSSPVFTTEEGIKRVKTFFGKLSDWKNINDLIPASFLTSKNQKRTGKAGIFSGTLELSKEGNIIIKQNNLFDDIFIKEK